MKIGITTHIYNNDNIWSNSIFQNAVNLYILLKNIQQYDVFLINTSKEEQVEYKLKEEKNLNIFKIDYILNDVDLLIILGSQLEMKHYYYLKNRGVKIVYYVCGSMYFNDMENVLFSKNDSFVRENIPDEIWIIPQNYETNKYYLEALYKKDVKSIPFIWSPVFINLYMKYSNTDCYYKKVMGKKTISTFEPNVNVVKYTLYNILICELAYSQRKDLIEKLYVTNTKKIRNSKLFIDTMKYLDIVKDGVATFEDTYVLPYFLENYTDVVVSHQMYNHLNYLYLDVLYLNYPLVHNAHMIKDAGYFYEGFNAEDGKEQLLFALTEHDKNIEEYEEKSKKVLERYLPSNKDSVKIYKEYIENLMNK